MRAPNDRLLLLGQPFAPDPVVGRHPDRDAVDAGVQAGPVVAGRLDDAGRVGRVVGAQHPEHDGVVGHRPGQRAGRVDAPRDRPYAHPADAAEGGLEADQVAVAGGMPDGARGVGADGEQAERRRDGRSGAAAGRPRAHVRIPGVAAAHRLVVALAHLRDDLADQDGAGLLQQRVDRRVLRRDVLGPFGVAEDRPDAPGGDHLLERERHAVERPAAASFPHLALGLPRTVEGVVRRHRDEGVEAWLQLGDALQGGLGQLDGRDGSAPQQLPGGADGQAGKVYRSQLRVSSLCDDEPLERRDQGPDPPTVVLGACGDEAAVVTSEGLTGPVGAHHLSNLRSMTAKCTRPEPGIELESACLTHRSVMK